MLDRREQLSQSVPGPTERALLNVDGLDLVHGSHAGELLVDCRLPTELGAVVGEGYGAYTHISDTGLKDAY